jgi:hypothetical protein
MAAVVERAISRYLRNPFSVWMAAVGDSQPAVPSFYTEPGINFNLNGEWVKAKAYNETNGVLFTVRKDISSFELIINWQIKEMVIDIMDEVLPGTKSTAGTTFTFDGTDTSNKAVWLQSSFNDDSATIRWTIPRAKASEPVEIATGEGHVLVPTTIEAIYDPADSTTYPTVYISS